MKQLFKSSMGKGKEVKRNTLLKHIKACNNPHIKLFETLEELLFTEYKHICYIHDPKSTLIIQCANLKPEFEQVLNAMREAYVATKDNRLTFTTKFSVECLFAEIDVRDNSLAVTTFHSDTAYYKNDTDQFSFPVHKKDDCWHRIKIDSDGKIKFYTGKKIQFPMSFSAFRFLSATSSDSLMWLYVDILCKHFQMSHHFWKDIYKGGLEKLKKSGFPSVSFKLISESHNMRELMRKIYKIDVPKSFNKLSLDKACAIAETAKQIPVNLRQKIYALGNVDFVVQFKAKHRDFEDDCVNVVFYQYYKSTLEFNTKQSTREAERYIEDYIYLCKQANQPLNLKIKTIGGLIKRHDELVIENRYSQSAKELKIPYTKLSSLALPSEFVRIEDMRSLIHESVVNSNCVWSYADKINFGNCIIYTLDYNDEHCTVEIVLRDNKFVINQISTRSNATVSAKTRNYAQKAIKAANVSYQNDTANDTNNVSA